LEYKEINRYFLRFKDRAEKVDDDKIQSTFVEVGPIMDILSSENNHIIYGRRGVGKTHALRYLANLRARSGDLPFYIDLSNLGSDSSIYTNGSLSIPERATRLLIDVVNEIAHRILEYIVADGSSVDMALANDPYTELLAAISKVRVTGDVVQTDKVADSQNAKNEVDLTAGPDGPRLGIKREDSGSASSEITTQTTGQQRYHVEFGEIRGAIDRLLAIFPVKMVWIILDEWSSLPVDLQPYLADLIRRSFLHSPQIVLKIAAIEHRSQFYLMDHKNHYIGFETGADISGAINLDNYLVFDNDPQRSTDFFRVLLTKHLEAAFSEGGADPIEASAAIQKAFTQENSFREFVRATEGVPRDAMHLLAGAAQKAWQDPISMDTVRKAAHEFYQTDKLSNVNENIQARNMLQFIYEKVISHRQTRAFLLSSNDKDEIIDYLFDRRLLHIIDRSKSAAHRPGERFKVYKIDYGCYVDLANTERYPSGMLFPELESDLELRDVPQDDARSFRRAILDLGEFYLSNSQTTFIA